MSKNKNKINICGINHTVDDPFYRYQMNKLNVVSQRNTTAITNIEEVSKDIDRDPLILIEYLKCKFNITFVYKKGILTTAKNVTYDEATYAIKEFLDYYVLCSKCHLPETYYEISDNIVQIICKCCSNTENLENVTKSNKTAKKAMNNITKIIIQKRRDI